MAWEITASLGDTKAADEKLTAERDRLRAADVIGVADVELPGVKVDDDMKVVDDVKTGETVDVLTNAKAAVQAIEDAQLAMAPALLRYVATLLGPKYVGGMVTVRGSGIKGKGLSITVRPPLKSK